MNKVTKRLVTVLGVSSLALTLSACSSSSTVASYKGGSISQSEFYKELKKSDAGQSTLQNMIIADALEQQYGSKVTDKQVNAEYNKYKKQYGSQFKAVLQQNSLTEATFKKNIKTNLLTEVALKDLDPVTEKEEKAAWKDYEPAVTVQHILVENEDTAKEVITKLDAGEDFAKLAKEYSTDTANKDDGGKLAAFDSTDTSLDSTFKEAAFKLKTGEYTKTPVKTQYGYHVIKMIKHPAKGTFKEHKKEIDESIYASKMQDQTTMQKVIGKVLKKADVSIKDSDLKDALASFVSSSSSSSSSK